MATALKTHLEKPGVNTTMCGKTKKQAKQSTDQPRKTTCVTCQNNYLANKQAYSSAKRKATLAKKVAAR